MSNKFENKELVEICEFIIENFNEDEIELEKYIINNIEQISIRINLDIDEFYISIKRTNIMDRIVKRLKNISENELSTIKVEEKTLVYIKKNEMIDEEYLKRVKLLDEKIENLIKDEIKKGKKFEVFCTKFLNDLGIKSTKTRDSNDEGVDIIGVMQSNNIECIVPTHINVIAQVKNTSENIDVSYIRKFIGDSLFIKFSKEKAYKHINNHPLYLMFFSSSGFTYSAIEFAKTNGVYLFSGKDMMKILALKDNFIDLKSVKYLLDNF